jgi:NAD(P)-dependent dehydrogenase (short-subunit alcohol dehydrogenase family)
MSAHAAQPVTGPRIAIVSHATRYGGPGAVSALASAGYTVVCHDELFADDGQRAEFDARHRGAVACAAKTPAAAVTHALKQFGRLDVVVSNDVYPLHYLRVEDSEAADMRRATEALLVTPATLVAKAAAEMKRQAGGYIVLITSAAPRRPEPGFSIYSSVRAGASAFAQAAARELAAHRITVNAIAPSFLDSELYYPSALWGTEEGACKLRQLVPVGRLGTAAELGALIVFLASGMANFMTGEIINFTGGWP